MSDDQEISGDDILEETPSISPMAMSVPNPEAEDDEVGRLMLAHRKMRLRKIVRASLGACVAIIVAATIRTGVDSARPAHAAASEAPRVAQPAPPPVPVGAPAHESAPATGTITAPRGQTFTVDGTLRAAGASPSGAPPPTPPILSAGSALRAPHASAIVTCGPHTVRVGRDAPQTLDVPCGKTVMAGKPKK